jgi:Ca2+-binding EF-hand superfamily protein
MTLKCTQELAKYQLQAGMSKTEFTSALRRLGLHDQAFLDRCFAIADESKDGRVDFQEFFDTIFVVLHGNTSQTADFEFSMWAGRESTHMNPAQFEEFYATGCRMDHNRSAPPAVLRAEAQSAFRRADGNGDGLLDRGEFVRAWPSLPSQFAALSQQHHF